MGPPLPTGPWMDVLLLRLFSRDQMHVDLGRLIFDLRLGFRYGRFTAVFRRIFDLTIAGLASLED
jgi:hypothetical protein